MFKVIPTGLKLPIFALAFLVGDICLQLQSQPVSLYWVSSLIPICLAVFFLRKYYWLVFLISGFFLANLQATEYIEHLPDESIAKKNILISGYISDLPIQQLRSIKFRFIIQSFKLEGYKGYVPDHINLSWYYSKEDLKPGDKWQFLVRLKPPSGFQNRGGFDYEAWLYQQDIHATGYIRKSHLNKKIEETEWTSMVNQIRFNIREFINLNTSKEISSLLNALAIGYRNDMTSELWQVFINTGTNHLIAISGLHIALVAGFVWGVLRFLTRFKSINTCLSRRNILLLSFSTACVYAALAGFTIPTQRALIMLAVVYLGLYLYRQVTVIQTLSAALIIVLIISPNSVLSVGFWLSFLAVASISYGLSGRFIAKNKAYSWLYPQLIVIVALIPLTFYFFQQTSLIALLANVVAIPVVGIMILPVLLVSLIFSLIHTDIALLLLEVSEYLLSYLLYLLRVLSEIEFAVWVHSETDFISVCLAVIGIIILFLPYAFPARILSIFLLFPLLTTKNQDLLEDEFKLDVLDVGQGLSIFIQTKSHNLLYDAGARFSEKFDVGEKVVVPFLRNQGIITLHRLVISNGDNDHIGGAQAVIDNVKIESVIGRDVEKLNHANISQCVAGQRWVWDGVTFEVLHPEHQHYSKRNNYSCVLKVSNKGGSVLITGDIEKKAENELLKKQAQLLNADVLIVPHHGSKTSSSYAFIQAVQPELAIYSSGYLNRYRFPKKAVVERYKGLNIKQLNTAKSGHISLIIGKNRVKGEVLEYRQEYQRYWHRKTKHEYIQIIN